MGTVYISHAGTPAGVAIASEFVSAGFHAVLTGCGSRETASSLGSGVSHIDILPDSEENIKLIASELHNHAPDVMICCPAERMLISIEHGSADDFDRIMRQNAKSAFFLTKYVGGLMAERKCGKIIYIGSIHAEKPTGSSFAYACSMSAMKMLCREAALQLGREGVSCVYLENGPVESDDDFFDGPLTNIYDDMDTQFPGRRPCTWEQAAKLASALAREDMYAMNGAEIRTDAGFTLTYLDR